MVLLYPPAWRARYGEEFLALLEDTGTGFWQFLDILPAAAAAWTRPARHLHNREERLRTTVAVTLYAWSIMAAGAVLFAKVTRDGAWHVTSPGHPAADRYYDAFVLACCTSVLALAIGTAPLVVVTLAEARRRGQVRRTVALLSIPLAASLGFLSAAATLSALVTPGPRPDDGIGPAWFLVLAVLGVGAAVTCAAGPASALARARPKGASLTAAALAGACSVTLLAGATLAALASQLGQPGHQQVAPLVVYGSVTAAGFAASMAASMRSIKSLRRPA
jgi:hypothetical protein